MKSLYVAVTLILISALPAYAGKWSTGTTAPATCAVGDSWTDTNGTTDNRFYTCTATNTWTLNNNQTAIDTKANKAGTVMQWSEWSDGASFTTSSPPVAYSGSLYKCIAPYTKTAGEYPDTQTEYFAEVTGTGGGISHAPADGNFYASKNNAWENLAGVFAPPLGTDDNYVTDAEKLAIGNLGSYALTSSVLAKTNTTAFTPTTDYHPATKKYVDDSITASGGYTDEQAQDAAGAMFSGNTETGVTVTYDDATGKVNFVVPTTLANFTDDATHRLVTDTEKTTWNAKQNTLVAGTDYLSPTGSAANLTSFPSSLATDAEVATAVSGKANSSAFASAVAFETAFGWAPGSGSISLSTEQDWTAVQNFNSGLTATGMEISISALSDIKFGTGNWVDDTKGNGDTNYLWSADKIFDQLAGKQATLVSGTNIKTVNSQDITGSGNITIDGSAPTVQSADPTAASADGWYAATGSGDIFYKSSAGLFTIAGSYAADPATQSLTITPSGFTGADKFTYSSTDYTTEQVITGLSTDASFTVTPDTGRAITCAGTGLTDNTGGSYTANTDTASVAATCTSSAVAEAQLFGSSTVEALSLNNDSNTVYFCPLSVTPNLSGSLTKIITSQGNAPSTGRKITVAIYNSSANHPTTLVGSCGWIEYAGTSGADVECTPGSGSIVSGATYWVGYRGQGYGAIRGQTSTGTYKQTYLADGDSWPADATGLTLSDNTGTAGKLQIEVTP